MKAAYISETGPAEKIQFGDLPTPTARDGQVLVRIKSVAVNPIDTYIRNGANYWELPKPFIIGADFAGVIESLGPNTKRFQVAIAFGDRIKA